MIIGRKVLVTCSPRIFVTHYRGANVIKKCEVRGELRALFVWSGAPLEMSGHSGQVYKMKEKWSFTSCWKNHKRRFCLSLKDFLTFCHVSGKQLLFGLQWTKIFTFGSLSLESKYTTLKIICRCLKCDFINIIIYSLHVWKYV